MEATGEPYRTERELPDEPGRSAAPPPRVPTPPPAERRTAPRDPDRLPFARRRPR